MAITTQTTKATNSGRPTDNPTIKGISSRTVRNTLDQSGYFIKMISRYLTRNFCELEFHLTIQINRARIN